jgi:hypothetical protein
MLDYELSFHKLTTLSPEGCHSILEAHLYGLRLKPSLATACFWAGTNKRLPTMCFLRAWQACQPTMTQLDYAMLCDTLDKCPMLLPESDVSHLAKPMQEALLGGLVFREAVFETREEAHRFCQKTKLKAMCLFLCNEFRILPVGFYHEQLIKR